MRADILKIYHDTPGNGAHFGRDKTTRKIQERYYWPTMVADIRNHIKSCLPCTQNNHLRQKTPGKLKPIPPPEGIWKLLSMDFHGPITPTSKGGNKYIISLTDVLSKFVIAKPVRDCTATTAANFLINDVILKYGTPTCILTDNGTHFTAQIMNNLFQELGVTHLYSTVYHPQTNGQIERFNATMDAKIAALCNERRTNWDEMLPFVTFNYNTSIHATTKQTPFEMMHGRQATLPFDQQHAIISLTQDPEYSIKLKNYLEKLTEEARKNVIKNQQQYKAHYDLHRQDLPVNVNDLVLVKTRNIRSKFDLRYEGPFRIIKQLGRKTFIVQHVKKTTLTKQVTMDVIVPLVERWNLNK
jgi:transposase InsO family protein